MIKTNGRFVKGHKLSEITKQKIREANIGKKSPVWKGNNVGYHALHSWIERWKGTPELCENCGTTTAKKYEWANIDHLYKRILEDYIRLCTSCHRKYDVKNNNYKK